MTGQLVKLLSDGKLCCILASFIICLLSLLFALYAHLFIYPLIREYRFQFEALLELD